MNKKENYEYLEMLFSKRTKEEVLEQLTLKCEELLNLRNSYEKLTIEDMKKANIINELEKSIKEEIKRTEELIKDDFNHSTGSIAQVRKMLNADRENWLLILEKLKEKERI